MTFRKLFRPLRMLGFFATIAGGAGAFAQESGLDIKVRTTIDAPQAKLDALRTFAMYPPVEVSSPEKLVRPVAPATLTAVNQLLLDQLHARGFRGVSGRDKPEILITVQYGRGYLLNPYRTGVHTSDVGGIASVSVVGMPDMLRLEPGREGKRQAAEQEKLFFTIAAWEFGSMQKGAKPAKLWTTTMMVDDPDNRDIGQIYRQMIVAGGDYFNRPIDREEVEVSTSVREGRVEVGTARVVEEPHSSPKK